MKQGKVWLVGAGPSDAGLFTLKGKEVLQAADVVLYDTLVDSSVLNMIPPSARKIHVGKRAGSHTMPQSEINQLLLEEAQTGNFVVRLKGGDPFLFGRGGEELELLCEHNIPFEVVPGVTSAISVPAYAGIPVTHRDFCSSLHIITGHQKAGAQCQLDYPALAKLNGTLVFLMGVRALHDICNGLIGAGCDGSTPAAILEQGTTAHQRQVVATLQTLPAKSASANIQTPAIIVVGKVCTLAKEFAWAEKRPLGQTCILVTRPRNLVSSFSQKLRALGAQVIELPAICTEAIKPNPQLDNQLKNLHHIQWAAFTSVAGVAVFFDRLKELRIDIRTLGKLKFAAIGTATKKAIEDRGILVAYTPQTYNAIALAEGLAQLIKPQEQLLLPRAKEGTPSLTETLSKHHVTFIELPIYQTIYQAPVPCPLKDVDAVAFTSASTVKGFCNAMTEPFAHLHAYCIGQQTAAQALAHGFTNCTVAKEATIDSLIHAIEETQSANKGV